MSGTQYISLKEAASTLGVTRPTLYYYIKHLKIEKQKFPLDKQLYLKMVDFERMATLRREAMERKQSKKEEGDTEPRIKAIDQEAA